MRHILIIDDEESIRTTLDGVLRAAGYATRTAPNGVEGIQMIRDQPADLVITDLFMPEKEGIETIMELRQEFPDLKIIAMSGGLYGRMDLLTAAAHLGAHRILAKPFGGAELLAMVRELVRPE